MNDYRYRMEALIAEVDARTERVIAEGREEETRFRAQADESFAQMLALVDKAEQSQKTGHTPPAAAPSRRPEDDDDVDFSDIDWVNR